MESRPHGVNPMTAASYEAESDIFPAPLEAEGITYSEK